MHPHQAYMIIEKDSNGQPIGIHKSNSHIYFQEIEAETIRLRDSPMPDSFIVVPVIIIDEANYNNLIEDSKTLECLRNDVLKKFGEDMNNSIPLDPIYKKYFEDVDLDEYNNLILYVENEDDNPQDPIEYKYKFQTKIEICENCYGEGKHLLTSLRSVAFSSEDEDYDPDFMDEMREGYYDQICKTCKGTGRLIVIDELCSNQEDLKIIKEIIDNNINIDNEIAMEYESERRMGC